MLNFIKTFRADEDGAVTVDWVVLTAAIIGLGVAAISSVNTGIKGLGDQVSNQLQGKANTTTSSYLEKGTKTTTTP